jgi:hypothetical protein
MARLNRFSRAIRPHFSWLWRRELIRTLAVLIIADRRAATVYDLIEVERQFLV